MNLEKFVVVSGTPGVHKLVATRNNGLIIEDFATKRNRFVAIRQNAVTPLGTIGMYVDTADGQDTIALGDVFGRMLEQIEAHPLPSASSASSEVLRGYFQAIVPEHDQYRVHINDIKKCVKWFSFMHENGMFNGISTETAEPSEAETPAE